MRAKDVVKRYFPKGFPEENVEAVLMLLDDECYKEIRKSRPKTENDLAKIFVKWNQKWLDIAHTVNNTDSGIELDLDGFKQLQRNTVTNETKDILRRLLKWWV